MIHVLTGDGKGKTTSAIGMAVRAAGHGKSVLMVRFLKGNKPSFYGEVNFFKRMNTKPSRNISVMQYGPPYIVYAGNVNQDHLEEIQDGWEFVKYQIKSYGYDMLILDELNICTDLNLIKIEDVIKVMASSPKQMDIIITGRNAHPALIKMADMVTNMDCVKHYFDHGVGAREGIEF